VASNVSHVWKPFGTLALVFEIVFEALNKREMFGDQTPSNIANVDVRAWPNG